MIVLAALPFPVAFYVTLTVCTALLVFSHGAGIWARRLRRIGQMGILAFCTYGIASEAAFLAGVSQPHGRPLYVIGDSVSAGIQGPGEATWPRLLAEQYAIEVVNLAESGATVATATRQARQIGDGPGLVLLEIGGNDLFAPTPPAQFRKDLNLLLEPLPRPDRMVVMLELPVLPWHVAYSRIQRQAAKSCGVTLVPKRFFARVLRHKGATLDLAHLSSEGHRKMANDVAALLRLRKNPS
jgi:acyl-CoA thioesterase-1